MEAPEVALTLLMVVNKLLDHGIRANFPTNNKERKHIISRPFFTPGHTETPNSIGITREFPRLSRLTLSATNRESKPALLFSPEFQKLPL